MSPPAAEYSDFVEHPRYGKAPHITGLDVVDASDGTIYCHWHSPVGVRVPNTALVANVARQGPATLPVTHYFDARRICRKCRRPFLFFAQEQMYWYEELGFPLEADCLDCVPCRKDEQHLRNMRRKYDALMAETARTGNDTLELAECGLLLVEACVFSDKVLPRLRGLLKSLLSDEAGPFHARAEELVSRIKAKQSRTSAGSGRDLIHSDSTLRIHVLQHVPFEGLGSIEGWLSQTGARVTFTRYFESTLLPSLDAIDFIIVLGGPMSVNDAVQFPWLRDEMRFIAGAITGDKAVLGICLGAQLIAGALGARVYPGAEKEIGWFPVVAEPAPPGAFAFPASTDVFHWHGETFDLPSGARHLASSAACRNQAFQVGPRVIGMQFHLETTPESAGAMIDHCANELVTGRHIQPEAVLRKVPRVRYAEINALMTRVLEYLVTAAPAISGTRPGTSSRHR